MMSAQRMAPLLGMVAILAACTPANGGHSSLTEDEVLQRTIQQVQEAHTPEWMALPGVVGTGIGLCDGEPCIRVFLARSIQETQESIPDQVEGHRVEVEVTGDIQPRQDAR